MMLYREQRRSADAAALLRHLQQQLTRCAREVRPAHDDLVALLIESGELASAVADTRCADHDDRDTLCDTLLEAVVQVASAADASWTDRTGAIGAHLQEARRALEAVPARAVPTWVTRSVSEGFAYYAVGPELYAEAARSWQRRSGATVVWCVGLRTIGATLAAAVSAALRAEGVTTHIATLRPHGHPFCRRPAIRADLADALMGAPGAWWLVVDEGPGLSGSSIAGTAQALVELGAPADRVVLMPNYAPDVSQLPEDSRRTWRGHAICAATYESVWSDERLARAWNADVVVDIAAGKWRDHVALAAARPAVHPQHERRKYRSGGEHAESFVKFAGLGHYGDALATRAARAAEEGWAPVVRKAGHGWTEVPWIAHTFGVSQAGPEEVMQIACYLWFVRRTRAADHLTDVSQLHAVAVANARAVCGEVIASQIAAIPSPPAADAVYVDARLRPHEWFVSRGRLQKTDGVEHGDDHFFPGPCDIAWDVAGAIEEWHLGAGGAAYLVDRYIALSGDHHLAERLPFYRAAYVAFRAAYTAFGRDRTRGTTEASRFGGEHARYRARLEQMSACVS